MKSPSRFHASPFTLRTAFSASSSGTSYRFTVTRPVTLSLATMFWRALIEMSSSSRATSMPCALSEKRPSSVTSTRAGAAGFATGGWVAAFAGAPGLPGPASGVDTPPCAAFGPGTPHTPLFGSSGAAGSAGFPAAGACAGAEGAAGGADAGACAAATAGSDASTRNHAPIRRKMSWEACMLGSFRRNPGTTWAGIQRGR